MCYLRLDFESFDTNGLSGSEENNGGATDTTLLACQDTFIITVFLCKLCFICMWSYIYIYMNLLSLQICSTRLDQRDIV